jgi:arylsulfatase A-like enzyme
MTTRRVLAAALLLGWTASPLDAAAAERRPSVLVILADDQRADTIGALGNHLVRTPALDGLVARGTSFDRCYCMGSRQGAVCVPSRAMLLSGRSLFRVDEQLAAGDSWPEAFARAGLRTFLVGKWHNGAAAAPRLFAAGDAVFLGGMSDQWRVPVSSFVAPARPAKPVATDWHSSELFGSTAAEFVRSVGDEPFFAWVAFTAPHDPRQAPPEYRRRFDGAEPPPPVNFLPQHPFDNGELRVRDEKLLGWPRTTAQVSGELADYYACIEALDAQVGRLLAALEARGRLADTIVVFTSDHGLALGSHGLLGKQNLYEHSMRVPAVVAGPGVPAGRRVDALCYLFDLMATVGDLAGTPPPAGNEGRSLGPVLRGETRAVRDELLLAYRDVQRALVRPPWKLIDYPRAGRRQLFDLDADPQECHDLWADAAYSETGRTMQDGLGEAERAAGDPLAVGR